jgi:hypothetical protein
MTSQSYSHAEMANTQYAYKETMASEKFLTILLYRKQVSEDVLTLPTLEMSYCMLTKSFKQQPKPAQADQYTYMQRGHVCSIDVKSQVDKFLTAGSRITVSSIVKTQSPNKHLG